MLHKVAIGFGSLLILFRRHLFFSSFELSTNGVRICPVDLPEFIMFEKKMNLIVPVAIHGTPLSMFECYVVAHYFFVEEYCYWISSV
jgi:hypothetical protein